MIQAIHTAVPGRARYRVEGLYRSECLKRHLEARLLGIDSIHAASASTLTGNILVHFDPARSAADIMALLDGVVVEHKGKSAHDARDHAHSGLGDRINMLYRGTLVTGGQGLAVVVATGRFTEMGKIQALVGEARPPPTPMERQLSQLGTQLALIGSGVCALVFGIGIWRGYGVVPMLETASSLAVAAIPEGLPAVATTTLALGMQRMQRHHVLMRRLEAVETLGSVQTICLDKTGALTLNQMSVVSVYVGMRRIRVADGKCFTDMGWLDPLACDELLRLMHVAVLCNETEVSGSGGEYVLKGSATESALLHMAISAGIDIMQLRAQYPLFKINHRAEQRNFMSSVHAMNAHGRLVALQGSPPEVLAMCQWYIKGGVLIPLPEEDRLHIKTENERMAGSALRVLGAAYTHVVEDEAEVDVQDGLIWLGLMGMVDPIRTGVQGVIRTFHQAGIDMVRPAASSPASRRCRGMNVAGLAHKISPRRRWTASPSRIRSRCLALPAIRRPR